METSKIQLLVFEVSILCVCMLSLENCDLYILHVNLNRIIIIMESETELV